MPQENLAAALYEQAQQLQDEARDLRDRVLHLYTTAGRLKALAVQAAETINPTTTEISHNAR